MLCSGNFSASATSLHLGWHAQPGNGSAGLSNHTTTGPETSADCLKIVLGLTKTWVRQADVLLTKHQQAKSLWPRTKADVLLTKHQQAKSLWPQTQDKAAAGKNRTLKLGKITVRHNSIQGKNLYVLIFVNCQLILHPLAAEFGSKAAKEVSTH